MSGWFHYHCKDCNRSYGRIPFPDESPIVIKCAECKKIMKLEIVKPNKLEYVE